MDRLKNDYFLNHCKAPKFPWVLYHKPLEQNLVRFLDGLLKNQSYLDVLVVGCGLMHELSALPTPVRISVVDTDSRAIDFVAEHGDQRLRCVRRVSLTTDISKLFSNQDVVYAKEVIEHIREPKIFLGMLEKTLKPGGWIWVSTPNYGEPWMPLIEKTALEIVARLYGFTRKGIHVSCFTKRSLCEALVHSGFTEVTVKLLSSRLALVAKAMKFPG